MIKKINLNNIIKYVLIILLSLLSLKKGGFYKSDILLYSLSIEILGIIVILYDYIKNNKKYNFDVIGILLLLLSTCYLLPIIFKNYASLSDSISEFIKYFNIYITYKIMRTLKNSTFLKNIIIYIGVTLSIIGIDGMGDRILENVLNIINSGYTNLHLNRMSSVIQYANVLGIILLISSIFSFEKIIYNIEKKEKSIMIVNYNIFSFLLFAISLTQSRVVILLTLVYYILNVLFSKNLRRIKLGFLLEVFIQILIFSTLIFKYLYINRIYIYYLSIAFIIFSTIIAYIRFYKFNDYRFIPNRYDVAVIVGVFLFFIFTFVLSTYNKVKISENSNDSLKRYIYSFSEDSYNLLEIDVEECVSDTRYEIKIYSVTVDNEINLVKKFNYYENSSGKFVYEFFKDKNLKCLKIEILVDKGELSLDKVKLNDKNVKCNYGIVPYEFVQKIYDTICGSDSAKTRLIYVKDALKIWNLSWKNRIIGVGGDGFKNLYQLVQDVSYTSTKVHNSYIQLLVEGGVLGALVFTILLIYYILNYKNDIFKYALILLIIHSIFDIDFSYMIILQIFAVLLAGSERRNNLKSYYKYLEIFEKTILIPLGIFCFYTTLKLNIAYYFCFSRYTNIGLNEQKKLVDMNEFVVRIDSSENKYRKKLAQEYFNYLKLLNSEFLVCEDVEKREILIDESKKIILSIEKNAKIMRENNKYEKNNLIEISNIYFDNLNFIYFQNCYIKDTEDDYTKYIILIEKNLEFIETNYKYNKTSKELLIETCKSYMEKMECYDYKNYPEISEFYQFLNYKISNIT